MDIAEQGKEDIVMQKTPYSRKIYRYFNSCSDRSAYNINLKYKVIVP